VPLEQLGNRIGQGLLIFGISHRDVALHGDLGSFLVMAYGP
jgi:hypothetical protein